MSSPLHNYSSELGVGGRTASSLVKAFSNLNKKGYHSSKSISTPFCGGTYPDLIQENLQQWLLSSIFKCNTCCSGFILNFPRYFIESLIDTGDVIMEHGRKMSLFSRKDRANVTKIIRGAKKIKKLLIT